MEKRNDKKFFKYIKKTWEFMKDSKKTLVGYLFTSILEGIIGIILPIFSAKIILNITDGTMQQLLYTAITVLVIELVLYLGFYYKGFLYQKAHCRTWRKRNYIIWRTKTTSCHCKSITYED